MSSMFEKLEEVEQRYCDLDTALADPAVYQDRQKYQGLAEERAHIEPIVEKYRLYKQVVGQIEENRKLLGESDADLRQLAREELDGLTEEEERLGHELQVMLLPRDPRDEKNVILEIRAGTGGEEAALFAFDLFRMYSRFAESKGWSVEVMSQHLTGLKGLKEVVALIKGKMAYSRLRYESGVHRVQRVPETETQGRIHTSAVTVAVLPEADDVDLEINPNDLKIDVYRSSGPGGQSVNTTDSAVRITHIPTGLVVSNQDEKSQHKNKAKALKILKSRLLDIAIQEQQDEIAQQRKTMVGSGDRSERVRTYNFPQGRVSDHRINYTVHKIESIMMGDLQDIIDRLISHYQSEALKASMSS